MIYHAELSCLTCGYDLGDVEGKRGAPTENLIFLPVHQGDTLAVDEHGHVRCPRCRGRVLPHGMAPVRRPIAPDSIFEGDLARELNKRMAG